MALRISKQVPCPAWPLTQWCATLWSEVGGHREFLRNLPSGWPRLTPVWPLTPAMSYTLIRGSSCQIWWPYSISKLFVPYLTPADPFMTFDPSQCITLWSYILPTKYGGHGAFLTLTLTPGWPLYNLWPNQCIWLW